MGLRETSIDNALRRPVEGRRFVFVVARSRGFAPGYYIARLWRFDLTRYAREIKRVQQLEEKRRQAAALNKNGTK